MRRPKSVVEDAYREEVDENSALGLDCEYLKIVVFFRRRPD
jgi:hypothetical protein